jgi:NtrC-family two-component system sensor histidine kinase KinB
MKFAIKLRTRLFLSISALITVALLGLVLGLVSVMQMANSQESLLRDNFITLDIGLKMRQSLGDQLIMMLDDSIDTVALGDSQARFQALVQEGIAHEQGQARPYGFARTQTDYQQFLQIMRETQSLKLDLNDNTRLTEAFNQVRNGLLASYRHWKASPPTSNNPTTGRSWFPACSGWWGWPC